MNEPTLTLRQVSQCCVSVAVFITLKGFGDAKCQCGEAKGTLSQLSQQKKSRMGGAHFCWKDLVYHPPICMYRLTKRYIYNKYRKKKHSMPSAGD